jgi:hypothetical protein
MFLIFVISQIVNWKIIEDVLGLRKCYQCGGETLVPVVKHSVSDSKLSCRVVDNGRRRFQVVGKKHGPNWGSNPGPLAKFQAETLPKASIVPLDHWAISDGLHCENIVRHHTRWVTLSSCFSASRGCEIVTASNGQV